MRDEETWNKAITNAKNYLKKINHNNDDNDIIQLTKRIENLETKVKKYETIKMI
jgi:hypothetical protein